MAADASRKRQRGFTDFTVNLLLTTLAAGVVSVERAPLVLVKQKSAPAITAQPLNAPLTLLLPLAGPAPFLPAEFSPPKRRVAPQSEPSQNRLLDLLAAPEPALWPRETLAAKAVKRAAEGPSSNLLLTTLAPPAAEPFPVFNAEWPAPALVASSKIFEQQNLLLTTLAPAIEPFPFFNAEWPQPILATSPAVLEQQNLLLTTLAPVVEPAVARTPLIIQTGKKARFGEEPQTNLLLTTLAPVGAVTPPFAAYEWPPTRRPAPRALFEQPNRILYANVAIQRTAVVPAKRARKARQDAPQVNLLLTTLTPQAGTPPLAPIWIQAPRTRVGKAGEPSVNLLLSTLVPQPLLDIPFRLTEWPPYAATKDRQRVEFPNLVAANIPAVLVPLPPGAQHFPGPERRPHRIPDPWYFNPSIFSSLVPLPPPGSQLFAERERRGHRILDPWYYNLSLYFITPPVPSVVIPTVGREGYWDLRPKLVGESRRETWDFISMLPRGAPVASASVSCTLYSGSVNDASSILAGTTTLRGQRVSRRLVGGTQGQIYTITVSALTATGVGATLVSFLGIK
jgi:hypothetical protein